VSALKAEMTRLIEDEGPVSISRYMALCLGHPRHGYYMTRDPFGARGDFTTAPEISQMFGELVGLWAANAWQGMGSPGTVRLIELGPGRGTLMADALRVAKGLPAFREAVSVHLVETSPVLRSAQAATLAGKAVPVWHDTIATALDGPVIVIANEFLDALPLEQFVMTPQGWRERLVGLGAAGGLSFGLSREAPLLPPPACGGEGRGGGACPRQEDLSRALHEANTRLSRPPIPNRSPPQAGGRGSVAPVGAVFEQPTIALAIVAELSRHLAQAGGAALFIDYGSTQSGFGDTLQAMQRHAFVDALAEPGEADLTVHVDFARIAGTALQAGAATHGPASQADFLLALGLAQRAQALTRSATPQQAAEITAAFERLTDRSPTGMGELFKVLALSHPDLPPLPGFDLHRLPEQG